LHVLIVFSQWKEHIPDWSGVSALSSTLTPITSDYGKENVGSRATMQNNLLIDLSIHFTGHPLPLKHL